MTGRSRSLADGSASANRLATAAFAFLALGVAGLAVRQVGPSAVLADAAGPVGAAGQFLVSLDTADALPR